jgi:hypothetical protein
MSLEVYAFVSSLPGRATWQAAIDRAGIDLKLDPELDLSKDRGFSPCVIKGRESGFEILVEKVSDILESFPSLASVVGSRSWVISFRYGGDFAEGACAVGACHALLRFFDAVIYYPAEEVIYTEETSDQELRALLAEIE